MQVEGDGEEARPAGGARSLAPPALRQRHVVAASAVVLVLLLALLLHVFDSGPSASSAAPTLRSAVPRPVHTTGHRLPAYPPPYAKRKACRTGLVALTFDDGPSSSVTPGLVRELLRLHVPATFFEVGERVDWSPSTARLVARSGFLIGDHTYLHQDLAALSPKAARETLVHTDARLRRAGVHPTRLMRPPYGALDATARRVIHRLGMTPVLWTIDSRDWTGISTQAIEHGVLEHLTPHGTNVVLQHDGVDNSPATVRAVPREVREARRRGYCFTPLDGHGRPGILVPDARLDAPAQVAPGHVLRVGVTLDQPTVRPTQVLLRIANSTRTVVSHYLTVPAGHVGATYAVRVPAAAPARRFTVSLSAARGVRLGRHTGTLLVGEHPAARPTNPPSPTVPPSPPATVPVPLTISGVDRTVAAQRRGGHVYHLLLRLNRGPSRPLTLTVTARPGTARAGRDYLGVTQTITVPAGHRTVQVPFTVPAWTTSTVGSRRTFTVVLHAAHARIGHDATVTVESPWSGGH